MRRVAIFVALLAILGMYYRSGWGKVLPRTYLPSGEELSGMDKTTVHQKIDDILHRPDVIIKIGNGEYTTSYADLGITVEHTQLDHDLFSSSEIGEIIRLTKGLATQWSHKTVSVRMSAVRSSVYFPLDIGIESKVTYDVTLGRFVYDPPRFDHQIAPISLLTQIGNIFASPSPVLAADTNVVEHHDPELIALNARLAEAAGQGIAVRVKDGKEYTDIPLTTAEIKKILAFSQRGDAPVINVDKALFESLVMTKLTDKQKATFQLASAYDNMVSTINERFNFRDVDPVVLGIDDGPTSDGSLANRYIEVDLSQQKMYLFRNGKLYKEYRVSTGYDYPTPVGEFHVINKAPKAFSDIYNVWMEYWMAFKYANDIGAYLGIHEIAYVEGPKHQKIYNLGNYIGEPRTGGCIALQPGEAKEVYNLARVGMLVRVVE